MGSDLKDGKCDKNELPRLKLTLRKEYLIPVKTNLPAMIYALVDTAVNGKNVSLTPIY